MWTDLIGPVLSVGGLVFVAGTVYGSAKRVEHAVEQLSLVVSALSDRLTKLEVRCEMARNCLLRRDE